MAAPTPTITSPNVDAGAEHPRAYDSVPALDGDAGGRVLRTSLVFGVTGVVLFLVLALTGIAMRMSQAEWITLEPTWFYRLLTLHGAGMFVAVLMSMMGAVYYSLAPIVSLSRASMAWSYLLVLAGAVLVIVAVMVGGFGGAWTFLFPLPFVSATGWETWSAVTFLVGLVALSLGWGVFFLEVLDQLVTRFGSIGRATGISYLVGRSPEPPPASVVGATVVAIIALLANVVGAVVVIASLVYGADRSTEIDMLWAKNTTYSFGHTIMNLLIYMAAVMLYAVVPRYTGRAWKATKPLVAAWMLTFVAVCGAYTHHLYMDFVQPGWASIFGQVASSLAAIPVAVITVYTGLLLTWGSRYRWTLASAFFYLGYAGWLTGGIAAVADSLIAVNVRFHNTLWVPAHFHSYLLLGVMVWAIAFLVHLVERAAGRPASPAAAKLAFVLVAGGGYTLTSAWYLAGAKGTPRRWAVQPEGVQTLSSVGTIGAILLVCGVLVCCWQVAVLGKAAVRQRREGRSTAALATSSAPETSSALAGDGTSPFGSWTGTYRGLAVAIVAVVVGLSPWLKSWSEQSVEAHHVVHAVQFGAGGIVGLWLGSTGLVLARLRRQPRSMAALGAMPAQAAMMAVMAPVIYRSVEQTEIVHMAFHLVIVVLGIGMGLSATRFARFNAWFVVSLGVFGALLWAPGVA